MPPDRREVRHLHGHCGRCPCTPQGLRLLRPRAESNETTPCPRGQVSGVGCPNEHMAPSCAVHARAAFAAARRTNPASFGSRSCGEGRSSEPFAAGFIYLKQACGFAGIAIVREYRGKNIQHRGTNFHLVPALREISSWYGPDPRHGESRAPSSRILPAIAACPRARCRRWAYPCFHRLPHAPPMVSRCPMSRTVDRTRRATIVSSHRHGTR